MSNIHVIVTTENSEYKKNVWEQLKAGDTVEFLKVGSLVARKLDSIISQTKTEIIVIINHLGPIPMLGFLDDFRSIFISSKSHIRRGDETIEGGWLIGNIGDVNNADCICFSRSKYYGQLRNLNPFSDYKRCITELILITNNVMVPAIRKFPDLEIFKEIIDSGGVIPKVIPTPLKTNAIQEPIKIPDVSKSVGFEENVERLKYLSTINIKERPEDRRKWNSWMLEER